MNRFTIVGKDKNSYITVDSERIYLSDLYELLTNYVINEKPQNGNFFEKNILIPANNDELGRLFGLNPLVADQFFNKVKNDFDSTNRHYRISINSLENIFPSPNLAKFDFIEDRSKRLDLRRKIQKELGDVRKRDFVHQELTDAIVESLRFTNINCYREGKYFILELMLDTKQIRIPLLIEAIIESITKEKIDKLVELVDKTPAVLTLLFYQSHLDESVQNLLEKMGEIQRIPMERVMVEQLLVWKTAKKEGIKINLISEKSRLSAAIQDMKLAFYLKEIWIPRALSSGIIIPDLKELGDYGKGEIKPAITTFVSTSGLKLEAQWQYYQKLNSLKLFNENSPFAPADIETKQQWVAWATGLSHNQFINGPNEDPVKVILSPVENRILTMIGKNRGSINQLEQEFVRLSDAKNALKNYYIDTLIQKGKIRKNADHYVILKSDDKELSSKIASVADFVNVTFPQNQSDERYVSQTKQREAKVIVESDYINAIKELLSKREQTKDEDEILRISHLIISLYAYYNENFRPIVNAAQNKVFELFSNTKRKLDDFKFTLDTIVTTYNKLINDHSKYISSDMLLESITKKFKDTVEIEFTKTYDKKTIENETKNIWNKYDKRDYKKSPFHFEKPLDEAFYFNLKYYKLFNVVEEFNQDLQQLQLVVDRTKKYSKEIEEAYRGISASAATFVFDKNHKISSYLLELTKKNKSSKSSSL